MTGFAVRNDQQGWRAVGSKSDCSADEHFSASQPTPVSLPEQEVANATALAYLAETDWYVIRNQETGEAIPTDVLNKRAAAREAVVR